MAKKRDNETTQQTFTVMVDMTRRADAPDGYVPPSKDQVADAVKEVLERQHEAFEATVSVTAG